MRLVTILESTTERSASGMSVCDGDLCRWAAKVLITASGSGSTSTDTRLSNTSTAKNRAVYYLKGQHTHSFHYRCQDTTSSTISFPILKQLTEIMASCTGVSLASSLKSISEPHDESHLLPSYLDSVIKKLKLWCHHSEMIATNSTGAGLFMLRAA